MKTFFTLLSCLISSLYVFSADYVLYKDSKASVENRVNDLIARMTLEEKILQLNQFTIGMNTNVNNIEQEARKIPDGIGSLIFFSSDPKLRNRIQKSTIENTRLGIPILFAFDVIHGFRSVYPISLGSACSWNPQLLTNACHYAAKEAKMSGIDWTFSPMIDVARDPRWGRVSEGYGEDPYVNSVFGKACVEGYQGKSLSDEYSIAACLKHYVGYSVSEGGRDYHFTDISRQMMWDTYLRPFKYCVEAGAATVMSSFNDISGTPSTANKYYLTDVLKKQWKHKGFVVSDWDAIMQLIYQGVAEDRKEAAFKAFKAGLEMDMSDGVYYEHLKDLVNENKINTNQIDEAVKRILRLKFELGLFEKPYVEGIHEDLRYLSDEAKNAAYNLAVESFVLLKNNNSVLPLNKKNIKLGLMGPLHDDKSNMLGSWSYNGKSEDVISIKEGIEKEFGNNYSIRCAKGCDFENSSTFEEALSLGKESDIIILCLGEKKEWSGENASRSTIALPKVQEELVVALSKLHKPIVLILSSGRPVELTRIESHVDAILAIWQPGIMAGKAVAKVLSGEVVPSGKLAMTFPLSTGQIPIYYNSRQCARPFGNMGLYQDIATKPLYEFGYGLSYTTFKYGEIKMSSTIIDRTQKIIAEVEVFNQGKRDANETVLWFISDPVASVSRPMKELKFFQKKYIKAGQSAIFRFIIDPIKDLSYYNEQGDICLENGKFVLSTKDKKVDFYLK